MTPVAGYISEICRLYVAVLLLAAAVGKSIAYYDFERSISQSMDIRLPINRYVAIGVIGTEYMAGLMSAIGGQATQFGMVIALSLSVLFTGFLVTMLIQGKPVRCNCFGGSSSDTISKLDLVRNAALMGSCIFYLFFASPTEPRSAAACLLLLAIALVGLLFTANMKGISDMLRTW